MLCPFAIVDRICRPGTPNPYGVLMLSDETILEDVKSLGGCKTVIFLDEFDTAFVGKHHNIEVVLCKHGVVVGAEILFYGVALLKRRMPVQLSLMLQAI
jgi:hypothetical protein